MLTTIASVVLHHGDTFLPRPPKSKKIKYFMIVINHFYVFFRNIEKKLLP